MKLSKNELTNDNILMYAILNYTNEQCIGISEFFEDFKKITYIKKKFTQYDNNKILKERLILNYLISLYNVFEHSALTKILFFKIPSIHHSILKTFLIYLNRIETDDDGIIINNKVADILRKI